MSEKIVKEVRIMNRCLICKLIQSSLLIIGLVLGFSQDLNAKQSDPVRVNEDWVYHSMELLAKEELIKDYPVEWVRAGHDLSRLELAYYLKQIILYLKSKNDDFNLPSRIVESLQTLMIEFQKELANLGIKTTDVYKVSPNPSGVSSKSDDYQDLDVILSPQDDHQFHYYYGQYYRDLQRKSFLFIPSDSLKTNYINVLESKNGAFNILYQPQLSSSYLVLKGSLPAEDQALTGYYLFPIGGIFSVNSKSADPGINDSIISLLDEVSQIQQVDNILRYNESLNLEGFLKLNVDLAHKDELFVGDLNQSLSIGGLLVFSNDLLHKTNQVKDIGLPVFNARQTNLITPVDLDQINSKTLQSLQINIQGNMEIAPQTSLFGGIDFLYQRTTISMDNLWPSDTKASVGVSFRYNDYWTFLTYQSLVNNQNNTGWFSTTSVGVEYNNWVTLWLAYQFLKFDNPLLTGTLSFRF